LLICLRHTTPRTQRRLGLRTAPHCSAVSRAWFSPLSFCVFAHASPPPFSPCLTAATARYLDTAHAVLAHCGHMHHRRALHLRFTTVPHIARIYARATAHHATYRTPDTHTYASPRLLRARLFFAHGSTHTHTSRGSEHIHGFTARFAFWFTHSGHARVHAVFTRMDVHAFHCARALPWFVRFRDTQHRYCGHLTLHTHTGWFTPRVCLRTARRTHLRYTHAARFGSRFYHRYTCTRFFTRCDCARVYAAAHAIPRTFRFPSSWRTCVSSSRNAVAYPLLDTVSHAPAFWTTGHVRFHVSWTCTPSHWVRLPEHEHYHTVAGSFTVSVCLHTRAFTHLVTHAFAVHLTAFDTQHRTPRYTAFSHHTGFGFLPFRAGFILPHATARCTTSLPGPAYLDALLHYLYAVPPYGYGYLDRGFCAFAFSPFSTRVRFWFMDTFSFPHTTTTHTHCGCATTHRDCHSRARTARSPARRVHAAPAPAPVSDTVLHAHTGFFTVFTRTCDAHATARVYLHSIPLPRALDVLRRFMHYRVRAVLRLVPAGCSLRHGYAPWFVGRFVTPSRTCWDSRTPFRRRCARFTAFSHATPPAHVLPCHHGLPLFYFGRACLPGLLHAAVADYHVRYTTRCGVTHVHALTRSPVTPYHGFFARFYFSPHLWTLPLTRRCLYWTPVCRRSPAGLHHCPFRFSCVPASPTPFTTTTATPTHYGLRTTHAHCRFSFATHLRTRPDATVARRTSQFTDCAHADTARGFTRHRIPSLRTPATGRSPAFITILPVRSAGLDAHTHLLLCLFTPCLCPPVTGSCGFAWTTPHAPFTVGCLCTVPLWRSPPRFLFSGHLRATRTAPPLAAWFIRFVLVGHLVRLRHYARAFAVFSPRGSSAPTRYAFLPAVLTNAFSPLVRQTPLHACQTCRRQVYRLLARTAYHSPAPDAHCCLPPRTVARLHTPSFHAPAVLYARARRAVYRTCRFRWILHARPPAPDRIAGPPVGLVVALLPGSPGRSCGWFFQLRTRSTRRSCWTHRYTRPALRVTAWTFTAPARRCAV